MQKTIKVVIVVSCLLVWVAELMAGYRNLPLQPEIIHDVIALLALAIALLWWKRG